MEKRIVYAAVVAVVVVAAVVAAGIYLTSPTRVTPGISPQVYLPTQGQVSSVSPGWKVISLAKFNYSQTVDQVFPGSDAVYQEVAENGNSTLVIWVIHFPGKVEFNQSIPNLAYGRYVLAVNVTGNTTPVDLQPFLKEEQAVMTQRDGVVLSFPSFLYPQSKNLNLTSFELSNITTPYGNFTQSAEQLLGPTSAVQLSVFQGPNATTLYSYFYGATQGGARNGTLDGFHYFNFTTQGLTGNVTYVVGQINNNVVFVQFQGEPQFQVFEFVVRAL
ncbi:hypothetical protein HS1genome_2030 [Sulfodiicoccus acidiphilus]|uniref:Uncharacterized protein n=1 Tax=Sulfodiicoccus acidiphilus TaxID=1670455 RepID=A0A348B639_9CREN|nr:hypothetical protein [Sulfodiicoccus acidiphilus]BBD73641.1 hypothetical protein HS1genome_2030 [Sulfodiicoccus acidiphilus]GGU02114.1 hypothetical protein GCM10007116_19050 [Sulfodiicoccus acidiphilus]